MDIKAWKKSTNPNRYFRASSGGRVADDPSMTHRPRKVARPYLTFPLSSRKLSVKHRMKHETAHVPRRARVVVWLTKDLHLPSWVKTGERTWNVRTEPVGRRLERWAVPLKALRTAFWAGVFGGLESGGCGSRRGNWRSSWTLIPSSLGMMKSILGIYFPLVFNLMNNVCGLLC